MIGSKAILERRRASINLSRAVSVSFPVRYTYEQCSLPSRDFDSLSSVPSRVSVCARVCVCESCRDEEDFSLSLSTNIR